MLRFISSLFSGPAEESAGFDEALIEKATERVLAGTDPRLRALGDCHKRLRGPVVKAGHHVVAMVEALPAPAEISPQAFGGDPKLRAFFASGEHLCEVLGRFNSLRDYLAELPPPLPDEIFGLLTADREERNVFAMEVTGDTLRRDVMQVAVNFSNHRYIGPTGNEADTRRELKKRAFDFLIEKALERIMDERSKRRGLDKQRHLLRQKLDAMRAGQWGLGSAQDSANGQTPNLAALEAEIEAVEAELGQLPADSLGLEESLACVIDTLSQPADWIATRPLNLRLDYRGIKVDDASQTSAMDIALTELFSSTGERKTVLLGRIARTDIPKPPDFWKTAKRYL